jgi:hypothetical protein
VGSAGTGAIIERRRISRKLLRVTTLGIQSSWQPQFIIAKIETTDEHP